MALRRYLPQPVSPLNYSRRHLDEGAKQIAAGRYAIELESEARERQRATLRRGEDIPVGTNLYQRDDGQGRSREAAAEKFSVGQQTVAHAVKVLKEGAPELVEAVERGSVSVSAAATLAEVPKDEQREMVAIKRTLEPLIATPVGRPREDRGVPLLEEPKNVENFHNLSSAKTRDKVAAYVGVSGRTIEKAEAIVKAGRDNLSWSHCRRQCGPWHAAHERR